MTLHPQKPERRSAKSNVRQAEWQKERKTMIDQIARFRAMAPVHGYLKRQHKAACREGFSHVSVRQCLAHLVVASHKMRLDVMRGPLSVGWKVARVGWDALLSWHDSKLRALHRRAYILVADWTLTASDTVESTQEGTYPTCRLFKAADRTCSLKAPLADVRHIYAHEAATRPCSLDIRFHSRRQPPEFWACSMGTLRTGEDIEGETTHLCLDMCMWYELICSSTV